MSQQGSVNPGEGKSKKETHTSDRRTERSLEESRKLILEWADELHHVDKVSTRTIELSAAYCNYKLQIGGTITAVVVKVNLS